MGGRALLLLLCSSLACASFAHVVRPLAAGPQDRDAIKSTLRALKAAGNSSRFSPPYNVCTSHWAPIVMCDGIDDSADYTGFQVALWREIARDLGWADSDWSFSCVDWTAMIDDLVDPDGVCSFAAAGVEVSLTNILLGLKFSWPIYKSGFHVLIASAVEQGGTWAFAEAFHWSVWVVLGATSIIVSFLVTAAETFTYGNHANRKGLRGWSWYSMGKMVQVPTHVGDPKTWASKVLVLGYAFLALIIVHLFTATTANKLTMQRLANDITSKADLPGKKVISWEPYVPLLRKYSIDASPMAWDNDDDMAKMLAALRSHNYQALVLDSPVVQYFAAQAEQCDLFPVGDPFETFNLAIAFPPNAPSGLASNVSASIVRLQTHSAMLDVLENKHVKAASATNSGGCNTLHGTGELHGPSVDPQIGFRQVAGVWYIQLITLGIALLLTFLEQLRYRMRHRSSSRTAPDAAAAAAASPGQQPAVEGAALGGEGKECVAEVAVAAPGKTPSWSTGTKVAPADAPASPASPAAVTMAAAAGQKQQQQQQPRQAAGLRADAGERVAFADAPTMPGEVL
ncbi:hypothetical protein OEZ85_000370 [Tetradesmus obliquus]|uniref:Ionotropic glutamate receptor C-terminal domain-containing protein n=1 Tax=Tetradesmus obliquus TaxID=3088 RepID=A0ABY8UQI6_TETOB|nr:hypothetical protein OEZ85_000370 [Tetradesmus obliquus]